VAGLPDGGISVLNYASFAEKVSVMTGFKEKNQNSYQILTIIGEKSYYPYVALTPGQISIIAAMAAWHSGHRVCLQN
jgi:hypothetical protein